jgi:hypothetical protein
MDSKYDIACKLLEDLEKFDNLSKVAREQVFSNYRKEETDTELNLRTSVDGLMLKLSNNMHMKINESNDEITYIVGLSASYIRTHFVINYLILNGDFIEAATLVRKQLECVTRLIEVDRQPISKLIGKTPNIQNIFRDAGKTIYKHLSEIAHSSKINSVNILPILENIDSIGPYILPIYRKDQHAYYDIHVYVALYFLVWLIK